MADFVMSFDDRSLKEIAAFYSFGVFLTPEMAQAMQEAGDLITAAAVANAWAVFTNPQGPLEESIAPMLVSPFEAGIGVGVLYGERREKGFSGMTDSLGRFYPYDPAKPYAAPALASNEQAVMTLIEEAALRAWNRISQG